MLWQPLPMLCFKRVKTWSFCFSEADGAIEFIQLLLFSKPSKVTFFTFIDRQIKVFKIKPTSPFLSSSNNLEQKAYWFSVQLPCFKNQIEDQLDSACRAELSAFLENLDG